MPTQEQARAELQKLIDRYNETDRFANLTEADVVQKYIEPLLRDVLGWDLSDSSRYLKELYTTAGRPDLRLTAENGDIIYVEAKKFGVIDKLEKFEGQRYMGDLERRQVKAEKRLGGAVRPEQLALPTMAVDRTAEEQQAINYAFKNGSDWAILSSFERFRLFNARRDWLVLSFEDPADFLHDFDLLWQLSYENILNGSLDYLSNQRYREDVDKAYLELINTWRQELASDLLKAETENPWIRQNGTFDLALIRSVVQRIIDRLVIARFAEDHLVIPPGTLYSFYEIRRNNIYSHSLSEFLQQFFFKFDENHNSALFRKGLVDRAIFSDEVLMQLVSDLYKVKFRAMPADILGNTYEQYLGKALVIDEGTVSTRDNLETRKKQGSYYTPQVIVRYMVDNSLGRYLYGTDNGKPDGDPLEGESRKTSKEIEDLRVLDSACGSGSFLIYAYQLLRDFYESEIARLDNAYKAGIASLAAKFGDTTLEEEVAVKQYEIERDRIRNYPKIILEQHIYGVDLDPQAAEIAVVNLMMRAMEKQGAEKRLPLILNQNVKVGNALIGMRPDDSRLSEHSASLGKIRQLRADLKATANTDPRHDIILESLNSELDTVRTALDSHYTGHFSDIERVRLFHWAVEFPEAFVDETGSPLDNPGFQVIIGNPPYGAEVSKKEKNYFGREYNLGTTDTAALFVKQALFLLSPEGINGYIIPKSLTYSSRWAKTRSLLKESLATLIDCGRVWEDVKLEQSIYIYRNNRKTSYYDSLIHKNMDFMWLGTISKADVDNFGFFLNGVTPDEVELAYKLKDTNSYLKDFLINTRGVGLQASIVTKSAKANLKVISGAQVQPFYLNGERGYMMDTDVIPDNARVHSDSILVQNIVAHVQNPVDHVKIISAIPTNDISELVILDTVNQLQNKSKLSIYFFLGLLHSEIINWFVYRFIFAKAIRTMHFDGPVTERIPLPKIDLTKTRTKKSYDKIIEIALELTSKPQTNIQEKLRELNNHVYVLYDNLNQQDIDLIKSGMP